MDIFSRNGPFDRPQATWTSTYVWPARCGRLGDGRVLRLRGPAYWLRTPVLYPRPIGPGGASHARVYDDLAKDTSLTQGRRKHPMK